MRKIPTERDSYDESPIGKACYSKVFKFESSLLVIRGFLEALYFSLCTYWLPVTFG
jgi:hypothetical protein